MIRAIVTVLTGAVIVGAAGYAVASFLGWDVMGAIALAGIGAGTLWLLRLPRIWRPW